MSEKLKAIVTVEQLDMAEGIEIFTVPELEARIRLKKDRTFKAVAHGIRAASQSSGVPETEIIENVKRMLGKAAAVDVEV